MRLVLRDFWSRKCVAFFSLSHQPVCFFTAFQSVSCSCPVVSYACVMIFECFPSVADAVQLNIDEDGTVTESDGQAFVAPTSAALRATVAMAEFPAVRERIMYLTRKDPLYELSAEDRALFWKARRHIMDIPEALPWFLQVRDGPMCGLSMAGSSRVLIG